MDDDVTCAAFDQKPASRGECFIGAFTALTARGASGGTDEAAKRRP
ncbi:hypothetical protein [Streptomyces sp. NPDC050121]